MAIDERELDDAFLVEAAQQGDDDAFSELFRRHYSTVRRVCTRRLGNASEADEVAQAAFVRAYERIDQCVGERRFGAWVQVIAYRLGADARRSQARDLLTEDPMVGDAALGPNHCEDELLRSEEAAEVHEVLASLPPRQREVIVARDLEGKRPGEIAASLGLSLGAVDSLLLRARRRMASTWQSGRPESGLASPHVAGASLVATSAAATVGEPGSLRLLSRVGDAIARASFGLANGLGVVGSAPTLAQRVSAVAAGSMLAAIPIAAVVPSPPTVAPPVHGPVSAVRAAPANRTGSGPANGVVSLPPVPPVSSALGAVTAVSIPITSPKVALPDVGLPPSATSAASETSSAAGSQVGVVRKTVSAVTGTVVPAVVSTVGAVSATVTGATSGVTSAVTSAATSAVSTVTSTVSGLAGQAPAAPSAGAASSVGATLGGVTRGLTGGLSSPAAAR